VQDARPQSPQPHLRILILAPQPFFQNRGTPIAIRLLATELAALGHEAHLLVFHEGEEVALPGVTLHRSARIPGVGPIPPGFSIGKIICDFALFFKACALLRQKKFDIVHACEEAAFLAMALKIFFGIPYIYDMDSSLPTQLIDKMPGFRHFAWPLKAAERMAARGSVGVVAVCQALVDIAVAAAPDKPVARLEDISLLEESGGAVEVDDLRAFYHLEGPVFLYVGNLEGYQGIDLLLDAFHLTKARACPGQLVIIGGTETTIAHYKSRAMAFGIGENVIFHGPRPVEHLGAYLAQADILVSPRIQGNNTPMKLYSYLDSARAIIATNLPTHTQVLDEAHACLVETNAKSLSEGLERLAASPELRRVFGERGRELARQEYSLTAFRRKLAAFYQEIGNSLRRKN
jgi:glycosyltransferase involved in cell wall biosynthesis